MRIIAIVTASLFFFINTLPIYSQTLENESIENGGEYLIKRNDANNPCISSKEYEILDKQCAENRKLLGLDNIEKNISSVLLNWPLRAKSGFNDCSYYIITAYVDQDFAAGAIKDYYCGNNTYDTHKGTDIASWPFPFYKMDNSQVEVISAAAGTIINKSDGYFDRNCSSNSLTANFVVIQHSDGSCALYWHLKSGSVTSKAIGQNVAVGEYLGVVGSSGSSSGPHLHFEIWAGGTSATYNDPFSGSCNSLNANSWWATQKPHSEPSVIKASVHITDAVIPDCDTTETPNESTIYHIPFQGPGLPAGKAKFYIFIRDQVSGTTINLSILNPGVTTFDSWTYNCTHDYNGSYWTWTKALPTLPGRYTFQATYNGTTCSQSFDILPTYEIMDNSTIETYKVFPNPSNGVFTVENKDNIKNKLTFEIYNVLGNSVFQSEILKNKSEQETNLQKGIYIYQIKEKKLIISSGKIIIE